MKIYLKKGREKALRQRHQWIFSGAIMKIDDEVSDGDIVAICDHSGNVLGSGYYNGASQISARVLTFGGAPFSPGVIREIVQRAVRKRRADPALQDTDACRLVHSEGDFLPGLVADIYAGHLVYQSLTLGIDRLRDDIIAAMREILAPESVYERSDHGGRALEGLEKRSGQVTGVTPDDVIIRENGMRFHVDIKHGQKTGFFLDQREHRALVRRFARGRKVLNLFAYTGGFTVAALAGGAAGAVSVDSSEPALAMLDRNIALNGIDAGSRSVCSDAFDYLRSAAVDADFIILDPPAFAKNRASVHQALRGYKDINLQAMKKILPGSYLLTFSCSRFISMEEFQRTVFQAALDSGKNISILIKSHHPTDHPLNIYTPETDYLKGLLLHVE